jgi:acetoacetyl-CoA synthetase
MSPPIRNKEALWRPIDPEATVPAKFLSYVNQKHELALSSYHDLYRWSVDEDSYRKFWEDAYSFLQVSPRDTEVKRVLAEVGPNCSA